jgi:hypothetical protein
MATYSTTDLFGVPDDVNAVIVEPKKRSPRKKQADQAETLSKSSTPKPSMSTPPPSLPGQGFLPGLSRRGRPRLAKPISAVERTAEHRRKRIANGAKRVEIILESEVSRALDRLAQHHQEPRSDVIAMLIRKAAARLKV